MGRNLIATVGSNPLPVVIVSRHLQPPKLWLLCTKSTANVCRQVQELLEKVEPKPEIVLIEMGEGLSLREAREHLRTRSIEWTRADLNYTAGTKQMAVVVHELWKESNSPTDGEADACYLSSDGVLLWDNGRKEQPEVLLSLEDVARLHFDEQSKTSDAHKDEHKLNLSHKIRNLVCELDIKAYLTNLPPVHGGKGQIRIQDDEIFVSTYNGGDEKNFKDTSPWMTRAWELEPILGPGQRSWDEVTKQVLQATKINKAARLDAFKYLATEWLEVWLASFLEETGLFNEVAQSFKIASGSKEFELDVVCLKGSKIYTFSCTIDQTVGLVKSKALEAHHRTQRIGGDHAAFAVVSLSTDPKKVEETIKEERWHGHDRARIFGIEHLRNTDKFREELTEWVQR